MFSHPHCRRCRTRVSRYAASCPQCGAKNPADRRRHRRGSLSRVLRAAFPGLLHSSPRSSARMPAWDKRVRPAPPAAVPVFRFSAPQPDAVAPVAHAQSVVRHNRTWVGRRIVTRRKVQAA